MNLDNVYIFADGSSIGFNAFGQEGLFGVIDNVCDHLIQKVSVDVSEYSKILLDYVGYLHNSLTLEQRMVYIDKYIDNSNNKSDGR